MRIPEAWQEHDRQVRPYLRWHRLFSSFRILLAAVALWWVLETHFLIEFEALLTSRGYSGFSLFLAFFAAIAVFWELVSLPFSLAHYTIDRKFGVSRQSFGSWAADHLKGLVVGAALGSIVLVFTWYSATHFGSLWWLLLASFFLLFSVVLAQLAPVLLLPLFFKMDPLPEGELKTKLMELSRKYHVSVKEIFLLGLGAKTEKGNAAFMGLGKTKRIAIGDTIYQKYPADQVLAVFAHEMGHLIHWDIWKGLVFSSISLFVTFGLAHLVCQEWVLPRWFTWIEAPFGLFLYFVVVTIVGMPLGLLEKIFSRSRERSADRFAAEEMKMAKPLADALEALTYQNRSPFVPGRIREFLLFSHPAPWRRIVALRGRE